jgi:hypothetical protein
MNSALTIATGALPADLGFEGARGCARLFSSGLEDVITAMYLEMRLGSGDRRVDCLFAIDRPCPSDAHAFRDLAQRAQGWSAPEQQAWLPIARLGDAWAHPGAPLWSRVPAMWLELDDVRRQGASPPSVCMCLVPAYARPFDHLGEGHIDEDLDTVRRILELLGMPPSPADDERLRRCFACLPPEGRFIHLSVMLGREPRAVKLYGTMRRAALLPYLREIGWRGEFDALAHAQETLYDESLVGDEVFFDLNLANFDVPDRASMGLSFSQQHVVRGPDRDPGRRALLDRLVGAGLCRSDEATMLAAWPGTSRVCTEGKKVPQRFVRFLDVKLVWEAGRGLQAKAYLGTMWPLGLF